MSAIDPGVWKQIESSRPVGDELIGRPASPDATPRLLAAIDSRGRRHLLVSLMAEEKAFQDGSSRGLTIATQELTLRAGDAERYIDIACEDASGHPMLDLIGGELAGRLAGGGSSPAESVERVLAKWRRFWGRLPQQLLSHEAQLGLFAELWFLAYWLIPAVGISNAVRMWRGPHGARHDFERTGLSVECKGTASTGGGSIRSMDWVSSRPRRGQAAVLQPSDKRRGWGREYTASALRHLPQARIGGW